MGRELKRVPLDFDWPLNKPWKGFINPLYVAKDCTHCKGRGESPKAKHLSDQWYGYAPFKPEDRGSKLRGFVTCGTISGATTSMLMT